MAIETDPFDFAVQLQKVLAEKGLTVEKFAARMDKSTQWLRDYLALNKVIEPIRALYRDAKIGMRDCTKLGYLPPERQVAYVEKLLGVRVERSTETRRCTSSTMAPRNIFGWSS